LLTEDFFAFHNHSAEGYEQDTEFGNTAHLGDCHEILPTSTTPDYKIFGDPTSG
ncbi:SEMA6D isoform 11, partial [Pan troglodytes]